MWRQRSKHDWVSGYVEKITRRESVMRVSRLKTQFLDFAPRQNESGNREPMKIIGEELEIVNRNSNCAFLKEIKKMNNVLHYPIVLHGCQEEVIFLNYGESSLVSY